MQWLAILILLGVAAWAVFAIRSAKKHRGCGGDCSHCAGCPQEDDRPQNP